MYSGVINFEEIGKKTLELTNVQRRAKGLKDLQWDSDLYKIAESHSKQMADGTVQFGHQGINDRFKKIPFPTTVNTENVAYHDYRRDPAEMALKIWINTEGNLRNMLGPYTHAGVGVAKSNKGEYFFTQLISCKSP
ncbi:hypothetical protein PPL_05685 [Heterostelium album PN500]|uniref:SCP domain-containing protein n=1 Tax=Heterostelium pallidum (strain ATCC 26659 / Pp 5 / PN500) TaxID=670386 RepID=D3BAV4_HETP5|nr:hypothetical protein PPL_05685 [Heterostelium album PN500]EFA81691.1 hypothetical protein PPL_05685 [Heterostelium album PN500]|eukprot:XP_020433808.1 hypothetical protein PPL_05685 [Heterostelium album PN500]